MKKQNLTRPLLSALVMLGFATAPPSASANILTFDASNCCSNSNIIDQTYGDVAGQLDVIYDGDSVVAGLQSLTRFISTGGLTDVAHGSAGFAEIFLKPSPGYQVTLSSFDFGAGSLFSFNGGQVSVLDGNGGLFFSSGPMNFPISSSPLNFPPLNFPGPNWVSSSGIRIQWGQPSLDAIDNVNFSVAPVPIPAAAWLFGTALSGLFGFNYRKQKNLIAA